MNTPEKQPIVLSMISQGTPEYPRFYIADQYLRYWTGDGWTKQKDDKNALMYADSNKALVDMNRLLVLQHENKVVKRYKAPIYIEVFSDQEIPLRDLKMWLFKATKLLIDSPKNGNGPVAGSLGTCRIEYSEMESY